MKLHRDLGITQSHAWYSLCRLRQACVQEFADVLEDPVEADKTYVDGLEKNEHEDKKLKAGRGTVSDAPVAGIKDCRTNQVRAKTVERMDADTLQGFVRDNTDKTPTMYTDENTACKDLDWQHETVKHSAREWVRGLAQTNGIKSYWAMFKRGFHVTYHQLSFKHLNRYVHQFAGKHNIRDLDRIAQVQHVVAGMIGKRLMYRDLIA